MCKFIGKSNEIILCKLSKSEILRLYSIVHVAMETTKTSNFICQSKSFISIFFTCQVSACELEPFSCNDLANDIYSQPAKTLFRHLKQPEISPLIYPHRYKRTETTTINVIVPLSSPFKVLPQMQKPWYHLHKLQKKKHYYYNIALLKPKVTTKIPPPKTANHFYCTIQYN